MAEQTIEARMEQLEQQNDMLLSLLQKFGGAPVNTMPEGPKLNPKITNNGWNLLFNPEHPNTDNRDWEPGTPKRWDPDKGYKVGMGTRHVGDGKFEWGYRNPETGETIWSGKLSGEKPPAEPPLPYEELERHLLEK